jgi:hypothetical protein
MIIMKNIAILLIFLIAFAQRVEAQRIFVPLLGGGYAEMGQGTVQQSPIMPLQPVAYPTPLPGPRFSPMEPIVPMQPCTPIGNPYSCDGND